MKPNGCTACFFCRLLSGYKEREACCDNHDYDYFHQKRPRIVSDIMFKNCLINIGQKNIANVFYLAVRIFGRFYWKKKNGR